MLETDISDKEIIHVLFQGHKVNKHTHNLQCPLGHLLSKRKFIPIEQQQMSFPNTIPSLATPSLPD
jgi:hypothetical protein